MKSTNRSTKRPTARNVLGIDKQAVDSESDLETLFFNQLVLPNGTFKTTYPDRLRDVDEEICRFLLNRDHRVRLLDVGISSGVTTADWCSKLELAGIDFEMDAFDICVDAEITSYGEHIHALLDSSRRVLQYEIFGAAIGNTVSGTLGRRIKRVVPIFALRIFYWVLNSLAKPTRRLPVKLVTRRLANIDSVNIFELDLMDVDSLEKNYDLIRVANLLNRSYFSDEFLLTAMDKLGRKLKEGGIICVVRTNSNNVNNSTFFQMQDGCLSVIGRTNNGSEIESLIVTPGISI